jgi:ribosome-associated protein
MADTGPIADALHELETGRGARSKREQAYERWRTSLLGGGDPAMTAFVAAHPHADVQALRTLVRNASRDPASPRGKAASRDLLRMVRSLGESASPVRARASDDDPSDDTPR